MGDVLRICQWSWSCCHFWQHIPGMNNKIIIMLQQREGERFVESIKDWAKDCLLMRWRASGRPFIKLPCHGSTKGSWREGFQHGWQAGVDCRGCTFTYRCWSAAWEGVTSRTPEFSIVRLRAGSVSATLDSFPTGQEALLTISSRARKRNGISGHVISLLESDSSLIINPQ